jgi:anti-sigma B factor antagonist
MQPHRKEAAVGLSVSVHTAHGVTTLRLAGEVDLGAVDELTAAIAAAVRDPGAQGVVVDLAPLSYLDSTGVAVLVQGRRLADHSGRAYRVVNASGIVERVLQITGVFAYLDGEPPAERPATGPPTG